MYTSRFTVVLLAAAVVIASCGKKAPSYTQYIPKDASYVVALDIKGMMTKLEKDSLSMENMLQVLKENKDQSTYNTALEYWKQFQNAGLDFENKLLVAIPALDLEKGEITAEVVAGLKDPKKLEEFIGKLPNSPKPVKEGNISTITTPDFSLGYNNEAVVILAKGGGTNQYSALDMEEADSNKVAPAPGASNSTADLLKKYFGLKKEESIASVEAATSVLAENADIAVYTSSASLANAAGMGGGGMAMAFMPKVKELVEGIYSTSLINFEDGKVDVKSNSFMGPKLSEILKKYAGPTVNMDLVNNYPSNNVNGIMAFSFKPELIPGMLKELGLDALANIAMAEAGTNLDEIAKAFKGEFAVIVSDFAINQVDMGKDAAYMRTEPSAKLVAAIKIGDKAAFDKLLAMGEKAGMLKREGNKLIPMDGGQAAPPSFGVVGIEGDVLVYSNDAQVYSGYAGKQAKLSLPGNAASAMSGKSVSGFVNVESILKGIPETLFDSTDVHEKNILVRSRQVFKSMQFNTGNFDGKKISGDAEILMESGKNSLPQLVRFLMYVAEEMKARDAQWEVQAVEEVELKP